VSAQKVADFLELSLAPGKSRIGDDGIDLDYYFNAHEIGGFTWGYPTY
jgi:hypothetical protein